MQVENGNCILVMDEFQFPLPGPPELNTLLHSYTCMWTPRVKLHNSPPSPRDERITSQSSLGPNTLLHNYLFPFPSPLGLNTLLQNPPPPPPPPPGPPCLLTLVLQPEHLDVIDHGALASPHGMVPSTPVDGGSQRQPKEIRNHDLIGPCLPGKVGVAH